MNYNISYTYENFNLEKLLFLLFYLKSSYNVSVYTYSNTTTTTTTYYGSSSRCRLLLC